MVKAASNGAAALSPVSNGAAELIKLSEPYRVSLTIEGASAILFHAWNVESVAAKSSASKNSRQKKTDDLESYVYRVSDKDRRIGIPGEYLRGALIEAGRYMADPRSPRKSARDLIKAAIVVETIVAPFSGDPTEWEYVDRRRVTIQRNAITRERPAFYAGWRASFDLSVLLPEYIDSLLLQALLTNAGRLVGLGDFRPSYGRFNVVKFTIGDEC